MTTARIAIVAAARGWIGTPYRHGASLRGVGCDCLGLVRGVWREVVGPEPVPVPSYAPDWAEAAGQDALAEAVRAHLFPRAGPPLPGDVLLFRWRDGRPAKHCGIATAAGAMVHAHGGACVAEVTFGVWASRLAGVFAFPTCVEEDRP